MKLKLFKKILIFAVLIIFAYTGLTDGAEPTIVQCRDTIEWLEVAESHISVILDNGSVQIFDSLGQEISFFDIDLRLLEFETADDSAKGSGVWGIEGIFDYAQYLPSMKTLLVYRNTYDPNASGVWGLIINAARNLFMGNSALEMYDTESRDRLFTWKFAGFGMEGIVNNQGTLVAIISTKMDGRWLQVIRIRDGKEVLREEVKGSTFFAFDSTTLHIYTSNIAFSYYNSNIALTYDIIGSDSFANRRKENLEFEIHPLLAYRPFFTTKVKYIFVNKSFTGDVGPAKCFGNDSLYGRFVEYYRTLGTGFVCSTVLSDYRILIYKPGQDTMAIADFSTGAWDEFSAANCFDSDSPPFYAFLTSNKYIALLNSASEFSIVEFELPDDSDQ